MHGVSHAHRHLQSLNMCRPHQPARLFGLARPSSLRSYRDDRHRNAAVSVTFATITEWTFRVCRRVQRRSVDQLTAVIAARTRGRTTARTTARMTMALPTQGQAGASAERADPPSTRGTTTEAVTITAAVRTKVGVTTTVQAPHPSNAAAVKAAPASRAHETDHALRDCDATAPRALQQL